MTSSEPRGRPARRALGLLLGVAVAVLATAVPATATDAAPQLSIAVDDGHTSTAAGATLTYTITVRNLGTDDVSGLEVTQSVPAGLKLRSTNPAAAPQTGRVGWKMDLKATGSAVVHSTMTVSQTPADLMRLATVACASTSTDGPPIVCAAHSDQLPAGAAAAANQERAASALSAGAPMWWYVGGAVCLLAVALVAFLAFRRRNRPTG
jgi:uncharacterized repeat protein (TIGR01451 family)